jgi:hypothetical protein
MQYQWLDNIARITGKFESPILDVQHNYHGFSNFAGIYNSANHFSKKNKSGRGLRG